MAIILLPCNYRIEVGIDGDVTLKESRVSEKGIYSEKTIGYYSTVESAVARAARRIAADTEEEFTLKEYLERHKIILKELLETLNGI